MAERAIPIWHNITQYVNETLKKPKHTIPVSVSFTTVESAVNDNLMVGKLQLFISVATVIQPYLQEFQADAPMLPFVPAEIVSLLEKLMQRFVKQSILESANIYAKLQN